MMISETKIKQRNSGKRKRIPLYPNLQQVYSYKKEKVMSVDLTQPHDIAPDPIRQKRLNARYEEELKSQDLPQSVKE